MHENVPPMATIKEKLRKWKETRSVLQKTGDVMFWVLLVLLILPGPRKVIVTNVNRVLLQVKNPGIKSEDKQITLTDQDYNWVVGTSLAEPMYMSDLRGEVIFLNFWATWCPPCVAELPEIQKVYEKYGHEVAFVLIANQEPEVVEAFMEKHGYSFPVMYPGPKLPQVFQSPSVPTTYIISREGKIVTKKTGAVNWDSKATDRMFEELLR